MKKMKKKLNLIKLAVIFSGVAITSGLAWAHETHAEGHSHEISAIGKPGLAAKVSRTVTIEMTDDMRFSPANISVKQGETVRFIVKNSGKLKHEFTLGTEKSLKEHYEVMKKFPEMEHDEPNTANVAAGMSGEVIWHFTQTGIIHFACLHPGHYEAGMKGFVKVAGAKTANKANTQVSPSRKTSTTSSSVIAKESAEKMGAQMKDLHEMHDKMKDANTPEERQALMEAQMKAMQNGMPADMAARQQAMEKRMEMMQDHVPATAPAR